jgi:carboxyl-terminal processing protease
MKLKLFLPVIFLGAAFFSCKDKNVDPATDTETNHWIYDQHEILVLLDDHIPAVAGLQQKTRLPFSSSLLYKYDADGDVPMATAFPGYRKVPMNWKRHWEANRKPGMEYKLVYYPV